MADTAEQPKPAPPPSAHALQGEEFRAKLRSVARRQWWLWSSAILITILLALTVASFAFPELLAHSESTYAFELGQAVRGLVGLVLLFNINAVYQQFQINRMQRHMSEQFDAMTRIEVRTEEVYKLAALDPLTGLYNRRSGEQRLAEEISRAQRHGRALTVILFDLNGLKFINDKFGHAAGDEAIKTLAARLARAIRGSDLAVRIGGDEFMVLLPECKPEEVRHVLGRVKDLKIEVAGQVQEFSFAAGWTDYVRGELPEDLLKRADAALYVNKRAAKSQRESAAVSPSSPAKPT
ncbi:MAG TPA: GGDEF domain-containing protein [Candidatus Acidoferrum sp.]|nr:GGDEF domain-containing protein [Candidatus Acidoferrum sp.]